MICPNCGAPATKIYDSRPTPNEKSVIRRRECRECGFRFQTRESVVEWSKMPYKRDSGSR